MARSSTSLPAAASLSFSMIGISAGSVATISLPVFLCGMPREAA